MTTMQIETMPAPLRVDEHGVVRVGPTRVTLDTVMFAFHDGASPEEIVDRYPSLALADVYATIAYYLRHRDAVDTYLLQRQRQAEQVRRWNEQRFPELNVASWLRSRRLEDVG